jgi:DNA-binding transcriptional MerR regulator
MENLVPIGRFSKICRLSVSSLRYYDEMGLLRPALVDPDTSYRYYTLSQVRVAETIRLLRALDMPLDEVHHYLGESNPSAVRELLNRHQRRMEERVEEGQRILAYLRRLQDSDAYQPAEVRARTFDRQYAHGISGCVPEQEVSGTWRALADQLRHNCERHGLVKHAPIGALFPDPVHNEDAVNLTVFVPMPEACEAGGRIAALWIDAGMAATITHFGPYPLLHRSYEQVFRWMQSHGHEAAGPPREIYRVGPTEVVDPNSYETEVIWPILPDGR